MPTRPVIHTPGLCGSYSDLPGASFSQEGGRVVILEPGGHNYQPPQPPQTYPEEGEDIHMVSQPETRPINPDQLMAEVKGILSGLLMVEAKCPELHTKQTAACRDGYQPKLNNEQLQALIALHHALLHEYDGSSLASRNPSAGPSLGRPAPKYPPSRMRCRQRGRRNPGRCWSRGYNRKINRGRWRCGR